MNKKILVAGLGNVFSGDSGFGPAVTFALREHTWPNGVEIGDFAEQSRELAVALGETPRYVRMVACEPGVRPAADEISHGLSPPVEAAIAQAAKLVAKLVREVQCA